MGVVTIVGSRVEAQMVVDVLREHGIDASASADDEGGMTPALQTQGVRVLAPDAQVAEARRLLGDAGQASTEPRDLNGFQRWIVRLLGGGKPQP